MDIQGSINYGKVFSRLDRNDEIEIEEGSVVESDSMSSTRYIGDGYVITLTANFDTDEYKLTIAPENQ